MSLSVRAWVLTYLVPRPVLGGDRGRDRARLLVYIHLLALVGGGFLVVTDVLFHQSMVLGSVLFIVGVLAMMYVLRRFGNLTLSGNLLVALVGAVQLQGILGSGGLYSDNVLWLLLAPVIAFLFTPRSWGIFWSLLLYIILTGLFYIEVVSEESYRYASLEFGARHHFVSYIGLFSGVLGVLLIFVRSNDETLAKLLRISSELRTQQTQTAAQNAQLHQREAELRRSNRDLELFAYVASHDLKEPLRMVNAYSQLIERRAGHLLPAREHEFLGFVLDGAERMQTMLDDLLDYSRLGRERASEEAVDLNRTLVIVRHNLTTLLQDTGGQLDVGSLPFLIGKPTHFVQVFQNLIANGLKFSRKGHPPHITITSAEARDGSVSITVADNGIGMREEDLPNIFGVFQRLHGRGEFEGSGIGLATVKRILDGLEATIEVESEVGVGSRFVMRFP